MLTIGVCEAGHAIRRDLQRLLDVRGLGPSTHQLVHVNAGPDQGGSSDVSVAEAIADQVRAKATFIALVDRAVVKADPSGMRTLSIATGFLPHVLEEASSRRLLIVGPHAERVRELFHNAAEHELRLERYLQVVADGRIKFEVNVSDQALAALLDMT